MKTPTIIYFLLTALLQFAGARIATATTSELVFNRDFESGQDGSWYANTLAGTSAANVYQGSYPHGTGTWYSYVGNSINSIGSLYQILYVPDGAGIATITFYLNVGSSETTTTTKYDVMDVNFRTYSPDALIKKLGTYSNLDKAANGDLTSIGTNSYNYDCEDRLVQLSLTDISNTFSYDGLGNRLTRTVSGQARRFVLDRMGTLTQVLVETDTSNAPVAYYIYGLGLAQRISSGGVVATYHFNLQGSTVAITDAGGNITDSYAFDSFGVLANSDGDSSQPFRYLGRHGIIDDGTGLLYARARYFSPQLARFISKDPVTGNDSDGQSLNRYVYALNCPLRFVDPTGLTASEGHFSQYNPYAGEAAYWESYNESVSWMIPYLKVFKFAGDGAQIALAFVTGGESLAARKAIQTVGTKGVTSVYSAVESGTVKYIGITDNLTARAATHVSEKGIIINELPGLTGLLRSDARAVEQVLIEKYGLGKSGGTLLNKINSISAENPIYQGAIERGNELLKHVGYPNF